MKKLFKSIKIPFYIFCILFIGSIVFGAILPLTIEMDIEQSIAKNVDNVSDIIINNLLFCLGISSGILFFSIPTILLTLSNGILLGVVIDNSIAQYGVYHALKSLVAHSIFELPAIALSSIVGLLPITIIIKIIKREEIKIKPLLKLIIFLLLLVLICIIIAAIIEFYITFPLMDLR